MASLIRYTLCLLATLAFSFTSLCARAYVWDGIVYPQTPGTTISGAAQVPVNYTDMNFNITFPSRIGNACSASGMGPVPNVSAYVLWRPKGSGGLFNVVTVMVDGSIGGFVSCGGASRTATVNMFREAGGPTAPGEYEFAILVAWQLCTNCSTVDDYTNIMTVSVGITNTPPAAGNASLVTNEDTVGAVGLPIYDPDVGDYHSFQILGGPSVGSAWLSGGVLYYSPPADWNGSTSVTYNAVDSKGAASNAATVFITVNPVNDPPVADVKSLGLNEDSAGSVQLSGSDIDSPAPTVFQIVNAPPATQGSVSIVGNVLTFTGYKDWNGSTSLTYIAQDNQGAWSAPATVYITVYPVNDPPVADPKSLVLNEDTSGSVLLSGYDIDSPAPTTFQIVSAPPATHGSVSLLGNTLTFTGFKDWNGVTSLTYRAQDNQGAWSLPVTVQITVYAVNDIPVADAKAMTLDEDTFGTIQLSGTDVDSPAPTVFQIVNAPAATQGSVSIAGSLLTFTGYKDWNGLTSLTYRAQDNQGAWSLPVPVQVTVRPVNDAPVLRSPLKVEARENRPVTVKSVVSQQ